MVLTEIYDILKEGQAFDEEKYKKSLEEMLQQSIDYEEEHYIETEWDKWDDLVQKGYECFENEKAAEGLSFWQDADDSCFRCGIGESLFQEGKSAAAYEYYEKWLAEEPQNVNGIISFSWGLFENGDIERAYKIVRKVTWGISCYADKSLLFMRAKQLADSVGKEDESKWYQQQLDKFEESIRNWEMDEDEIFDEFMAPKQIPIVKEKKIYPNDPCPCGSGKKYKKCCGKK